MCQRNQKKWTRENEGIRENEGRVGVVEIIPNLTLKWLIWDTMRYWACDYIILHGKRDFADISKVVNQLPLS